MPPHDLYFKIYYHVKPLLIVSCPLLRKNVVGDRGHTYSQTNTQTENTSSKLFRCNINYASKQV